MSFMRKIQDLTVTTNVPDNVDDRTLVSLLHDHERIVRLQPLIIDFRPAAEDDQTMQPARRDEPDYKDAQWYQFTEQVPVVGKTVCYAAFKDHENGLDSVVHAPAGLVMHCEWRVEPHESGPGRVLKEVNRVSVNAILLALFVKPNFQKAHHTMHQEIMKQAAATPKDGTAE